MSDVFEKLGFFYLGKHVDLDGDARPAGDLLLYRSKDLTTHGVIVGMTGSGKTGLGVALIEEAILDGIPVIAIDPKGDLGNLLLTFPSFEPSAFRPWVSESDAAARGMTADELAVQQAAQWREGLAEWGQDSDRISAFERAADRCIYTPGSTAGRPLSMLASFTAPSAPIAGDRELLGERIEATVIGLLSLLDIDADRASSREYILLANILDHYWSEGRDLDLAELMTAVQNPPFERVGMMGVETFFPRQDRFDFTLRLNHLEANPGFEAWMQGDQVDAERLFYASEGRPRLSIVSVAHLSDRERMFAVTALLNEIVSWMRSQPGTSTLRALLYVDEVFGFLPPVANPPSKRLFLTLLKQARAFGLGTVLSTQNPVDLDYKALSNAGTWFIGRLQTERDKARLLDGLSSAAGTTSADLTALTSRISALDKRQFVLHSVHGSDPAIFETRWVMSYLAGPMTREQIRRLSDNTSEFGAAGDEGSATRGADGPVAQEADRAEHPLGRHMTARAETREGDHSAPRGEDRGEDHSAARGEDRGTERSEAKPILPAEISEIFDNTDITKQAGVGRGYLAHDRPSADPTGRQVEESSDPLEPRRSRVHYFPLLFFRARVAYFDAKRGIREESEWLVEVDPPATGRDPDWNTASFVEMAETDLHAEPAPYASYDVPPPSMQNASNLKDWGRALESWIERNHAIELLESRLLGLVADSGESESDFRSRVNLRAREERDREIEEIEKKFEARLRSLEDRLQRAQHALAREEQQVDQAKVSSTIAVGQTILSALLGRKAMSRGTLSRAGTAARSASRIAKETADVERAREKFDRVQDEIDALTKDLEAALDDIRARFAADEAFETVRIRPRASETAVTQAGVLWKSTWAA